MSVSPAAEVQGLIFPSDLVLHEFTFRRSVAAVNMKAVRFVRNIFDFVTAVVRRAVS